MMNKLFTLLLAAACFTASAQIEVEYPYNPDNQNDGHVGIEDILEILTVYGEEFTPEQLLVEGTSLTEWIQLLSETVIQQQAQIDSLSSLGPTSVEVDSSWFNDSVLSNTLLRTRDWPLGFHGEVINHSFNDGSFVVPAGKALFITYTSAFVNLERGESYFTYVRPADPAAAAPYSQVIPIGPSTTVLGSSPSWWFSGVLIDTTGDFEVIYWEFSDGNYHVPEGKIFVPKWSNGEGGIKIQSLDNMWAPQIPEPHFHSVAIASQDVLSNEDTSGQMLGYLIDEDFFNTSTEQPSTDEPIDDNLGPCQGEFTVHYHGYDYELVEIGDQCWFAENCRFLPQVHGLYSHSNEEPEAYVLGYDGTNPEEAKAAFYYDAFGVYYNLHAVIHWELCPAGWGVSSREDWAELETSILGSSFAPMALYSHLANVSGFTMHMTGEKQHGGPSGLNNLAAFWLEDWDEGFPMNFPAIRFTGVGAFSEVDQHDSFGLSVRCVKD